MASQTTVKHGTNLPHNGVFEEIGDLGHNLTRLATLQARLASQDLQESTAHAMPALFAIGLVLPLALASATVGLLGVAYWLATAWNLSLGRTLLYVSVFGLAISGSLSAMIIHRLRVSARSFRRSREELERNVAWLGTVLLHSGR